MTKESHHDHEIIDEGHGPRWKEDPMVCKLVDDMGGLNNIVSLFFATGITKMMKLGESFIEILAIHFPDIGRYSIGR